jgi:hypothetical protein
MKSMVAARLNHNRPSAQLYPQNQIEIIARLIHRSSAENHRPATGEAMWWQHFGAAVWWRMRNVGEAAE